MNKIITTTVLFLFVQSAIGQKGIENLIQAEKDFAAWSIAHSTKEAFQKFIDSSSIMFDNGKPVKAIEFWEKREKRPGVLNWHPQFAEISASEDFGYTTGPWTFQNSLIDSTPAGIKFTMNGWGVSPIPDMGYTYGTAVINNKPENYFRIWRREKSGWKIAVEVLRY